MYGAAVQRAEANVHLRYHDSGAQRWLWTGAPCRWRGAIDLKFTELLFHQLRPATSWRHAVVVEKWLRRIQRGRPMTPLVVSAAPDGGFYVHDGNHRWAALRHLLGSGAVQSIRVAVAVPKPGFHFRYRWFSHYETYSLEPAPRSRYFPMAAVIASAAPTALLGRTLVLVAHPDDETGGCAGLLQRMREPIVVFATSGAPADDFFWRRFGSQDAYRQVRRREARRSLGSLDISRVRFLEDDMADGCQITDQELYLMLPLAYDLLRRIVRSERPDALLVPAYEGGHPDHDACSFLGHLAGQHLGIPVWEMPLYHRGKDGTLVCQRFREPSGNECCVALTARELQQRAAMIAGYASQRDLTRFVNSPLEWFRPQAAYAYGRRPHAGRLNYEVWQWPIAPEELCRAFGQCITLLAPRGEGREQRLPTSCPWPAESGGPDVRQLEV